MKQALRTLLLPLAMLVAVPVVAAGVDGTWVARINQSQLMFELKAEGEKLTGKLYNSAATSAAEIRDGTIKGDALSFHIVRRLDDGEIKLQWTGKLSGDEIRFQRAATSNSVAADFVATRVKD
jgi:hypothetical protein